MKRAGAFLTLLLACSLADAQPAGFIEGTRIGVTAGYPTQENPPVIFFNAVDSTEDGKPSGVWHTVTVPNVPADVKAVFLTGLLIITNETCPAFMGPPQCPLPPWESADLHIYFRAPGALPPPGLGGIDFPCQATHSGHGGTRNPCGVWVLVVGRQFQWWWYRSTGGDYANGGHHPAYGAKFSVNAYIR
jgi:hypothetical protein